LRNPGGATAALATVRQVRDQLGNASVEGNTAGARRDAFLTWCDNWGTRQLGNHFSPTEALFAELSESYWRLVMAPSASERQLNGIISRECTEWDSRLARLAADLEGSIASLLWPGHLVVLDTSALMEGAFFMDYDWHALEGSLREGPIRLILPYLVVEELDDLKRHRDGRQKAQARKVLSNLWDLHRANPAVAAALPGSPDVTVEVLLDGDWHQRRPNNDGEIIDQAVAIGELAGRPVILAAGDYTQLYRAAPAGLSAVLMPRPDEA